MALTDVQKTDFDAPYRDGEWTPVPVASGEYIPRGTIVCLNAAGYAVGGQEAGDLIYVGRAEAFVDNTNGPDGAVSVTVGRKKAFRWLNDGTITQAQLGQRVYVLDNRTLTASETSVPRDLMEAKKTGERPGTDAPQEAQAAARSKAGVMIMLDGDGVWIE